MYYKLAVDVLLVVAVTVFLALMVQFGLPRMLRVTAVSIWALADATERGWNAFRSALSQSFKEGMQHVS